MGETSKVKTSTTISNLLKKFEETEGNYIQAFNSLSKQEQELIKTLGHADYELQELCQAVLNNTKAIQENNKQIVNNIYSNNKNYEDAENKDLITTFLGKELNKTAEILYDFTYRSGAGISDADIQKQYAVLMNWDPELIESKTGKAIYYDEEHEDDDVVIYAIITITENNQEKKYQSREVRFN